MKEAFPLTRFQTSFMKPFLIKSAITALVACPMVSQAAQLQVTATNKLPLARASQTIEIQAADLAQLEAKSLNLIHVRDPAGKELVCQALDTNGDELRAFDAVIFQADFAAGETKIFTLSVGAKQLYPKERYKAFGRFVRERFDDFTWENDLIAHRTYGRALETWKGEPLTSSTIDIWSKRTPRMVISDWYLADDYHVDHGEGADFYSAGLSRGCGGSGLWADDELWVSKNFVSSNVLANGPIRVLFELEYAPFPVAGGVVSETRRISLDAGQQFDQFQSRHKFDRPVAPTVAAGLKKVAGEKVEVNAGQGWVAKWERMEKNAGYQGLAVIAHPGGFDRHVEDPLNQVVLFKPNPDHVTTYWAGFCWDKAGNLTDAAAWTRHVSEFSQCLASPLEIKTTVLK